MTTFTFTIWGLGRDPKFGDTSVEVVLSFAPQNEAQGHLRPEAQQISGTPSPHTTYLKIPLMLNHNPPPSGECSLFAVQLKIFNQNCRRNPVEGVHS